MPAVSVLLSSYNHEKYLRESIDSVLNQTFTDFELIIVDDASTDGSWAIIESYSDERIVKIRNPQNILFYANPVIENVVTGKYFAMQHSDDIWEPNKLAEQVEFLETHPEVGAVFSWAHIIDEEGKVFTDETNFYYRIFEQPNRTRHEWLNFFFYRANALCHPSLFIRKQCYHDCGMYTYGLAQLADLDMWIRLCMKHEIHVMPQKLLRFRVRSNEANTSGYRPDTRIRNASEFYQTLKNYLAVESFAELELIFPGASQYYRPAGCNLKFVLAMIFLEAGTFYWARFFGIELLFELMKEKETREELQNLYGFSHRDFLKITGENDLYSIEIIAEKDREIQKLREPAAFSGDIANPTNRVMECLRRVFRKLGM